MKAYAAWWLWARLGGWNENAMSVRNEVSFRMQPIQVTYNKEQKVVSITLNGITEKINTVTLVNASGKSHSLYPETTTNNSMSIDISHFPSGIYLIRFNIGNQLYTNRIVFF
jgi:hypothetical protein